jgi:hypothetical protein
VSRLQIEGVNWLIRDYETCVQVVTGEVLCWRGGEWKFVQEFTGVRQLALPGNPAAGVLLKVDGSLFLRDYRAALADWRSVDVPNIEKFWVDRFKVGSPEVCARTVQGKIWCWGVDGNGHSAIAFPSLDEAIYMDLSGDSYCAIRPNGQLVCGDFGASPDMSPKVIPELKDLVAIELEPGTWKELGSSGDSWKGTGCALTANGDLLCFGNFACDDDGREPSPPIRIIVDDPASAGAGARRQPTP